MIRTKICKAECCLVVSTLVANCYIIIYELLYCTVKLFFLIFFAILFYLLKKRKKKGMFFIWLVSLMELVFIFKKFIIILGVLIIIFIRWGLFVCDALSDTWKHALNCLCKAYYLFLFLLLY